jgi:tRNA G18 (ribose-2'-O)-methylase SpoU
VADPLQIVPIDTLTDPRVADYANLRDRQLRQIDRCDAEQGGVFMAEGELVVRQLIRSGLTVRSVLLTPQRLETVRDALAGLSPFTPVYFVEQRLMNQIVGFNIHRGILAAGQRAPRPPLHELLPRVRTAVVLENLANHDNVGGIFRVTAGLAGIPGAGPEPRGAAVLLSPQCCDPLYRKAIRVSVGTALLLPFAQVTPWPEGLSELKRHGFTLVALTPDLGATPITELRPRSAERAALLLGAEGGGLSAEALQAADLRVRIPMDAAVDSLNVVTAGAIALHELRSA